MTRGGTHGSRRTGGVCSAPATGESLMSTGSYVDRWPAGQTPPGH
jgi:hypothetical protein